MYVCMYVCMYVYVYVCMYVCMYVCVYVCVYVCMHAPSFGRNEANNLTYKFCSSTLLIHTNTCTHTHTQKPQWYSQP